MDFDLVTVGGVTVDLFLLIDSTNPHFTFNKETNELTLKLGDKIILDNAKFTVGGNAANVAVGLKRLGFKTSIYAEIGDDEFAHRILKDLKSEGVDIKKIKKDKKQTSFSIILNHGSDRTIFTQKPQREHNFSFNNLKTKWIYLTSLGEKWEETYKKVGAFVQKENVNLAFNPGGVQLDKELGSFSYLLPKVKIFIVNKEEGELMLDDKGLLINDLLFKLKKLGPEIVVVTDGEKGSYAINDKGEVLHQEIIKVRVVSRTGAGDAYASGFLGGIISGQGIKDSMFWGAKNASSVIKLIGAQAGLMSIEEIKK